MNGEYYKYPFSETLNYACIALFKLEKGDKYLKAFNKDQIKYMSPIKRERENTGRVELEANETYVLVASFEMPGTLGELYLSIYIDDELRDCEIKRVFHPLDKNEANDRILPSFIPEEAEKFLRAPAWKLALVREMIPYMMTEEDKGIKEFDTVDF